MMYSKRHKKLPLCGEKQNRERRYGPMPVMDEFKEEREALKHGTLKQKIAYFIDYYKWHTIIAIAAVAAVASFIIQTATRKDNAIYICMLNTTDKSMVLGYEEEEEDISFGDKFAQYAEIDTNEYAVHVDTSMYIDLNSMDEQTMSSTQKFMTYLAAAEMDVIVTDVSSLEQYAYQEDFFDLREILSPGQLEKYEPYFYYIDRAVVAKRAEALENPDKTYPDADLAIPDPKDPGAMKDPIPVGIYVNDCKELHDSFYFRGDDIVAGVFVNTQRPETSLQFLDFLME